MTAPRRDAGISADDRHDTLRQRIAHEAARGVEAGSDARRALFHAARRVARGWVPDDQLPSRDEIASSAQQRIAPMLALARLVGDRFDRIAALVGLLVTVRRNPVTHPEGDALEHALQVFDHVHAERPFDEELLTAALAHDVGLAIDRSDPVAAALEALDGLVTQRTRWFVELLPTARGYGDCTLGKRARHRLEAHPDFEDVLLLAEADRLGHVRGGVTTSLEEAVAILRALDAADASDDAATDAKAAP